MNKDRNKIVIKLAFSHQHRELSIPKKLIERQQPIYTYIMISLESRKRQAECEKTFCQLLDT